MNKTTTPADTTTTTAAAASLRRPRDPNLVFPPGFIRISGYVDISHAALARLHAHEIYPHWCRNGHFDTFYIEEEIFDLEGFAYKRGNAGCAGDLWLRSEKSEKNR